MPAVAQSMMTNCPICESQESETRYRFAWGTIRECRTCGGAFADGCDTEQTNEDAFANTHDDESIALYRQWSSERLAALQEFITSGTLIEFGPGTGEFLFTAAEAGFTAIGVDRFPRVRPENEHPRVSFIQSDARTFRAAGPVDAVVGSHVLEHFIRPYDFLTSVRENLNDKGYFLIEVPNYGSLTRAVAGRRWRGFVSYHALQLTPKSMTTLLKAAGFKTVKMESVGCSTSQIVGLGVPFIGRRLGLSLGSNWEPGGSFCKLAARVERPFHWGYNLRVVAQKL
ncbi:MAG TPA: class I SAM-dependent methyltransferase [Pyrinomonadaceae bacterium]|nr:class I SAM-dependent methyltransferase [Pyrinomonadaceae bacterium]